MSMSPSTASFRFVPLGVGDAFTALYYSTCIALTHDDGASWLLIDCPHPIQKMMREASLTAGLAIDPRKVSGLVLTHLHADHACGLEGLAYWIYYYCGRRLPLLAHPAVSARLWDGHLAAGMEQMLPAVGADFVRKRLDDFIDLIPLDDSPGAATDFAGFRIECRPTIHHIPTTALRLGAAGRTLGHSADTAYDESLIAWLAASDVIVHETNHGIHTPYERLAALPADVRAKMRLVHYPDDFDRLASVIEPLAQGRVYDV